MISAVLGMPVSVSDIIGERRITVSKKFAEG